MTLRVLVVDDHPIWREAVAQDLGQDDVEVVATAGTVAEAIRRAKATRPDVAVVDLNLPDGTGADVARALTQADPPARVLMLSATGEPDEVLAAVEAGASGYLLKTSSAEELRTAIRRTASGEAVFTPGLAGLVLGAYRRLEAGGPEDDERPRLTERETEVLRLVATGLATKQIATRLTLSPRTVENHVANTLRKLQLANRVQLARYAVDQGLT
jgi:DNA-binding NarL/FixJ family response regulator